MHSDLTQFWTSLLFPLGRLLVGMAAGLFLASILESLHWNDFLARLAYPLTRLAKLNPLAASAFALAAISPASANAFLSEKLEQGQISQRDIILSNLFNSLPANLAHLPGIFFITWPVLGKAALIYTGLSFLAAIGRTIFTVFLSRLLQNKSYPLPKQTLSQRQYEKKFFSLLGKSLTPALKKLYHRLPRLLYYTIPFYILIYIMNQTGFFNLIEKWIAGHLAWLTFIKPQAMSIIILQVVAEMGASLGAAGALLETGGLDTKDIVLAMLAGNILSTPMRALRHQFPAYAGFYKPVMALKLVLANQILRAFSMTGTLLIYVWL